MRAAFLTGAKEILLGEADLPPPGAGETLVIVEACGICGSNLHAWRHPELSIGAGDEPEPGAAGHEIAGRLADGSLVVIEPNLTGACGVCRSCEAGTAWFCRNRAALASWGFADAVVVRSASVFPVPGGVTAPTATLTEPLASAVHALRWSATGRAGKLEGATVAVLGSGVAGLLAQVAARELGAATVVGSARHPHQVEMARRLGTDVVVRDGDAVDELRRARPSVVIEAVGATGPTFDEAMRIVGPAGEVIVFGLFDGPQMIDARRAGFRETRLFFPMTYGTLGGIHDFDVALEILARRSSDLSALITHRRALDDIAAAFETASDKSTGGLRVVVEP